MSTTLSKMPFDMEMEQHALGVILHGGANGASYYQHHSPDLFFEKRHKVIAGAIQRCLDRGQVPEYMPVLNELESSGDRESAGGTTYLSGLRSKILAGAENALDVVLHLDDYRLRRFALEVRSRPPLATGRDEYAKLLAEIQGAQRFITPPAVTAEEAVAKALREIDAGDAGEVKIGIDAFDRLVGARRGDQMIIGAKTSVGKTNVGLNFARGVIERGGSAIIHSFEMAAPILIKRIFAHYTGIENFKIQRGKLSISEKDRVVDAARDLSLRNLWIRDAEGTWPQHLAAYESIIRSDPKVEILVIDYIGLVRGIPGEKERYMQLGTVSRDLKNLAKRLNVLVVALSQFNRKVSHDEKPSLENLRESGDLEQNADICVLVSAPEAQENKTAGIAKPEKLIFDIAKHRNGNTGEIDVMYDRRFCRIADWPTEDLGAPDPNFEESPFVEYSEEVQTGLL